MDFTYREFKEATKAYLGLEDDQVEEENESLDCPHTPCDTGFKDTWCVKCNIDMEIINGFPRIKKK